MDAAVASLVGGAVGLVIGVAAMLASRQSEREQSVVTVAPPASALPAGVADVLAVLRSSALVVDRDDVVIKASPAAYWLRLVRDDRLTFPELARLADDVRRTGEVRDTQMELTRGRGVIYVSVRVAPLTSELVIVIVEDRTAAHRVEAVRRDFVANVSHELKTPSGALALLAEAVGDAADDPEAVRRFSEHIRHEATRLNELLQDLIDLSRLQVQGPVQAAEDVEVDAVVGEAVDRCRLAAEHKSMTVTVTGDRGVLVRGDAEQLMTAVRNLIDNAVAYSPADTTVTVSACREADVVEIRVADEGPGIPSDSLDRVFERFYRVDPARSRATGGTGLGLSIVKHVAANHGGDVTVRSVEGHGSTFTIRLPALVGAPAREALT